jgi:hypothetical protein
MNRGQRTELNLAVLDYEVRSIGFIIDFSRFAQQYEEPLRVDQSLVHSPVNRSQLHERAIKLPVNELSQSSLERTRSNSTDLGQVCDKYHEMAWLGMPCHDKMRDDQTANQKAEGLGQQ